MPFTNLFSSIRVGSLTLKNRIIFPPVSTNLAEVSGQVGDRFIYHYARRAKGGAAVVTVENACIDYPATMEGATQPRFDHPSFVPALSLLVEEIHKYGSLAVAELTHQGLYALNLPAIAPSDVGLRPDGVHPHVLTQDEIGDIVSMFARAAYLAKVSGFDGVEIEAAHGLLVNQFLSPIANKREDEFGGSVENRSRIARMIIDGIRRKCGALFTVTARLGVIDYLAGGVTPENDGAAIARMLEDYGYAALHADVGFGDKEKRLEPMAYPQAWRSDLAATIKQAVDIPVIAVGVIREPEVAEKLLRDHTADIVALGRTLIADPDWPVKSQRGETDTIRRCVGCSECIASRHGSGTAIRCGVNANVGKTEGYETLMPASRKRKIVVMGGGPGGLEAARVSAMRGHEVVVFEQGDEIGGSLREGSVPPGKEKMRWLIDYYNVVLRKLAVTVRLSTEATHETVMEERPDAVVDALGSEPLVPPIDGIATSNVFLYTDVLGGGAPVAGKVMVGGGGLVGCETALYIAAAGNDVTIVEMLDDIALGMEPISRKYLLRELDSHGVKRMVSSKIVRLEKGIAEIARDGTTTAMPFDSFVVAFGGKPRKLVQLDVPVYAIGDALRIGKLVDAVRDGYAIGREI